MKTLKRDERKCGMIICVGGEEVIYLWLQEIILGLMTGYLDRQGYGKEN